MTTLPPIKSIAIIGAGASGLVAARALLAEKVFTTIDIFEQRPSAGGVWNYTPQTSPVAIPSTDPDVVEGLVDGVYPSAMYECLGTGMLSPTTAPSNIPYRDQHP